MSHHLFRLSPRTLLLATVLAAGTSVLAVPLAQAAQPYTCKCYGKTKRFFASTKKCEKDHKVKSCSKAQYAAFRQKACASNGCSVR